MRRRRRTPTTLSGGDSPSPPSVNSHAKTRKRPKYLSLRSQLSPPDTSLRLSPLSHYYTRRNFRRVLQHQKQPQPPVQRPSLPLENCLALDDSVALLLTSSDNASATLKGLLVDCGDEKEACRTAAGTSGEESVSLIRSAMKSGYRSREGGEDHEEKWVCYSEVVEKKEEEVSSSYCTATDGGLLCLSLKLDYQEVLDAWSDKGSLFIRHGIIGMDESPQTVPDLDGFSSVRSQLVELSLV